MKENPKPSEVARCYSSIRNVAEEFEHLSCKHNTNTRSTHGVIEFPIHQFLTSGLLRVKMTLLELISKTLTSPVVSPVAR